VIWWIARSPQAGSAADSAPAARSFADNEADVVVDAVPWGRLIGIEDADGSPLALPPETTTPLTLHLPPGTYTLTLTHPEAPDPVTCTVEVTSDGTGRCQVELLRIDANDYFEEAGWWQ